MSGCIWNKLSREEQNTKFSYIDQTHISFGKEWLSEDLKDIWHLLSIREKQENKMTEMLGTNLKIDFDTHLNYAE